MFAFSSILTVVMRLLILASKKSSVRKFLRQCSAASPNLSFPILSNHPLAVCIDNNPGSLANPPLVSVVSLKSAENDPSNVSRKQKWVSIWPCQELSTDQPAGKSNILRSPSFRSVEEIEIAFGP